MTEVKTCTRCGETKPVSEFSPRAGSAARYQSRCRPCASAAARESQERRASESPIDPSRYIPRVDFDDTYTLALVRLGDGTEAAFVEWNGEVWRCECGSGATTVTGRLRFLSCDHTSRAGQALPLAVAVLRGKAPTGPITRADGMTPEEQRDALRRQSESIQRGARARAERVQAEDVNRPVSSEVVVRQATPDDLERLRKARERKRQTYATPAGWAGFRN